MKTQNKIKILFQLAALILTIIQLHQSFKKYLKYPIVLEKSRIPVENLPSPAKSARIISLTTQKQGNTDIMILLILWQGL